jgi:hypothetical protein
MALDEASMSFQIERLREYLRSLDEKPAGIAEIAFEFLELFNPDQAKRNRDLFRDLTDRQQREYVKGITDEWLGIEKRAFDDQITLRDAIIAAYEKFDHCLKPYKLFIPRPWWKNAEFPNGRDIYVGDYHIGYQYILLLKQSGERGFSVRSAGAISDESLPEKSNENKIGKLWHSETPIRFGEYETPNFMIITEPEDFALITALYRSSIDGRRFMYEAILSEEDYQIPDKFTSRSAQILQVYLKSLGVRMETVVGGDNYIGEKEDSEVTVVYTFRNSVICATPNEMYYVLQLARTYRWYVKDNPNTIRDWEDAWDWVLDHLPFKKKHLTDKIVDLFKNNLEVLTLGGYA